ncbi:rhomboid family intramembrane serine protease [Streptomyces montanisoli]|uniref:Rhomboid family intramembrane serine protease n=1 Tax=Streptomyces montanisoli TaxID=2798581 RepID=A0A940MEI9_9ACTN|nr:rhomboid family intramembrane serine protease [Streptomyces montanisoli]MBP0461505.1 rhomboid family intramembrane serine protease [Streptomyces montanisoli]
MDEAERAAAAGSGLPGCYRHPDRGTGVRCTRCERPICPACMVSASVGFQCPDCVRGTAPAAPSAGRAAASAVPSGAAARIGGAMRGGRGDTTPRTVAGAPVRQGQNPRLVTQILIGINIAVFIAVHLHGGLAEDLRLSGVGVVNGEWYRLFTSIFDHYQIWHIGFNMLSLWWIGAPLEAALGRLRYTALYLISGLAGSALTYLIASPFLPSLGASGAIFGLFGATVVLVRRLRYDMRPVIALLAINLFITFFWANIAWQAHIGGLVAGALMAIGLVHAPRAYRTLVQTASCVGVLAVTVVLILVRTSMLT